MRTASFILLSALTALPLSSEPSAEHSWPQWMGPRSDGSATATGVFRVGAAIELRESWRLGIGGAYSSISVVDGRAYTLGSDDLTDYLVAVDVGFGKELWRSKLADASEEKPLSTPAVDDGRVFALNAHARLHAVRADDGSPIWSRDLVETLGARPPSHGMATSPLVEGDVLFVMVGGKTEHNLVAFDKASGDIIWSVSHAKTGSYSSPIAGTLGGQRQVVVPAADRLYGVRPEDGSLLWAVDGLGFPDRSPVLLPGDRIFLPLDKAGIQIEVSRSGDGQGGGTGWSAKETWRTERLKDSYSPAVHLEGSIYGFAGSYLTCLDASSGEERWRHPLSGSSLILVDRHLVVKEMFGGSVSLVSASPEGFEERAILWVFEEKTGVDTPPSFAGGRIFLRNRDEIVAVEVSQTSSQALQPGSHDQVTPGVVGAESPLDVDLETVLLEEMPNPGQ